MGTMIEKRSLGVVLHLCKDNKKAQNVWIDLKLKKLNEWKTLGSLN